MHKPNRCVQNAGKIDQRRQGWWVVHLFDRKVKTIRLKLHRHFLEELLSRF